jgi:hypothetical protein
MASPADGRVSWEADIRTELLLMPTTVLNLHRPRGDVMEDVFVVIDTVPGISVGELQARAHAELWPEIGVAGRGGLR